MGAAGWGCTSTGCGRWGLLVVHHCLGQLTEDGWSGWSWAEVDGAVGDLVYVAYG